MSLEDTKSFKNLELAFQKEAVTVLKYIFFADKARKEGREDIAQLFDKIRSNEIEHAYLFYTTMLGPIKSTEENLKMVADEENYEWKHSHPEAANIAKAEALPKIAEIFQRIGTIENAHEREFTEALLTFHNEKSNESAPISSDKKENVKYACMLCGYTTSDAMPTLCPVCNSDGPFITI